MRPLLALVAIAALAAGCPPPAAMPAPDDGGGEDRDAENACASLRRLGCPEGYGSVGGQSCASIVARRHKLRSLPLECWTRAESIPIAKGCGSLTCIR